MTLTFYDICLHYEVEHLQNDIESKEPREQTEQITTEYIEYIIAYHCMPLYVFARLCPSFALPSGDTLCIAKILMGQSFPDHPVVMCCLSFKIFKGPPMTSIWNPYDHMTSMISMRSHPCETSRNKLKRVGQVASRVFHPKRTSRFRWAIAQRDWTARWWASPGRRNSLDSSETRKPASWWAMTTIDNTNKNHYMFHSLV